MESRNQIYEVTLEEKVKWLERLKRPYLSPRRRKYQTHKKYALQNLAKIEHCFKLVPRNGYTKSLFYAACIDISHF